MEWLITIALGFVAILIAVIITAISNRCSINKQIDNAVKVEIVDREAIVETVCEEVGHSTGYGSKFPTYHEHYVNRDVIVGYDITFRLTDKDGKVSLLKVRKGTKDWERLMCKQ